MRHGGHPFSVPSSAAGPCTIQLPGFDSSREVNTIKGVICTPEHRLVSSDADTEEVAIAQVQQLVVVRNGQQRTEKEHINHRSGG